MFLESYKNWAAENRAKNKADADKVRAERAANVVKKRSIPDHAAIARHIETAVSDTFPDGYPHDHFLPKIRKQLRASGHNPEDAMKHADIAARKHLGSKNVDHYLTQLWDDHASDNPEYAHHGGKNNPWRGS